MAQALQQSLGTSQWSPPDLVADRHPWRDGSVWAGRRPEEDDPLLPTAPAIGFQDDRHVLVVGSNRAGKGTTFIVPNLCLWPGSVLVLDPKGENAMLTASRRGKGGVDPASGVLVQGMGQKTHVLDPYGQARGCEAYRARFNPMDELLEEGTDTPVRDVLDQVTLIVDAIVVENDAGSADPYWNNAAKDVLRALILHVLTDPGYAGYRNLVTVRRLLTLGDVEALEWMQAAGKENIPSPDELLWRGVANNEAFGGIIAGIGRRFLADLRENYKVFASVVSNAVVHTAFIDSEGLRENLRHSDFRLEHLKTDGRGISIFLCLPQRYMATHYRWMRIVSNLAVAEMERVAHPPKSGHRVLFMLDEFATLRRLEGIETAVSYIAGFGVKMAFVLQTLEQLKKTYPNAWETFYGMCSLRVCMGVEDNFTRDYLSKAAGETEISIFNKTSSTTRTKTETKQKGGSRTTTRSENRGASRGGSRQSGRGGSESQGENTGWSRNQSATGGTGRSRVRHKRSLFRWLLNMDAKWADDETFSSNSSQTQGTGQSGGTSRGVSASWNEGTGENWSTNEGVSLSVALGETWSVSTSEARADSEGMNEARQKRPLIAPEEIGRYFARVDQGHPAYPGLALMLLAGENPAIVRRTNYFEDPQFEGLFTPHPDFPRRAAKPEAVSAPAIAPVETLRPNYALMFAKSLMAAGILSVVTLALVGGYFYGLVKLGVALYDGGIPVGGALDVCGALLWSTLAALWFFIVSARGARQAVIAVLFVAIAAGLTWTRLSPGPQWNEALVMPVMNFCVSIALAAMSPLGPDHEKGWLAALAVLMLIWLGLMLAREIGRHRLETIAVDHGRNPGRRDAERWHRS